MRMCSTLALISCNAALRGRREGGGGVGGGEGDMQVDTDTHMQCIISLRGQYADMEA